MSDDYTTMDSEWNEAKAYFYRIHLCLAGSDDSSRQGDYHGQLNSLFTLHRELSAQMKPEELEIAEKIYKETREYLLAKNMAQFIIIDKLYEYELHLRKILKDRKMDLPRAQDPGRSLLN